MSPQRLVPIVLAAFVVIYVAVSVIAGDASYVLAVVLVVLLLLVVLGSGMAARRSVHRRHGGDHEAAMSDTDEPLPAAPFIADDATPLGDTTEAHDEISPHDLPKGHPGRAEAERRAGHRGTTRGDVSETEAAEKQPINS